MMETRSIKLMNARLTKLALAICCLSLLPFAELIQAQDTNASETTPPPGAFASRRAYEASIQSLPEFNIQIENGSLSLAAFKDTPEKNPWGKTASSVSATVDNLSKYLRAIDPNLNIVLSPDVGDLIIRNLKLNTRSPLSISQAISVASGNTIIGPGGGLGGGFGGGLRTDRNLTFIANRPRDSKASLEVFNLNNYILTLGNYDDKKVRQKIDELQKLIVNTLQDLRITTSSADLPKFKYHPGTKLLIVIGKPEALEVARKIIYAASGQQMNGKADLPLDTTPPTDQK
jgi:hypothetical protein